MNYEPKNPITPKPDKKRLALCEELQRLQRQRAIAMKSRIMNSNRLIAVVAGSLGYSSTATEKQRQKKFEEARVLIKEVGRDEHLDHPMASIIQVSQIGIGAFEDMEDQIEKEMIKIAKKLPVVNWAQLPNQRGFGLPSLATLIGETGDLANYSSPGKLWRRMGCAPFESSSGDIKMGATWKSGKEGKLSKEEWTEFGYCPRRRSISYIIGENLLKGNREGPYNQRYYNSKEKVADEHDDYSPLRCHRHAMLLATKKLLKSLWIAWNK